MTTNRWRKTQIYYNNWVIPGQTARVRRVPDGIELEVKSRIYARLTRTEGVKRIADASIRRVVVGRRAMIIEFDADDQIYLRKEVLQDCSGLPTEQNLLGTDTDLMKAMLEDQRRLGGVSWSDGRMASPSNRLSWSEVGRYNEAPTFVGLLVVSTAVISRMLFNAF